jgi:hypothetical protein
MLATNPACQFGWPPAGPCRRIAELTSIHVMPISDTRRIISQILLGFGMFFTTLALGFFALIFVAAASDNYEGGEQAFGPFFLYLLLAVPAFLFNGTAVVVRGWREARAGYITIACLFGIPLLTFIAILVCVAYDSLRHKPAI